MQKQKPQPFRQGFACDCAVKGQTKTTHPAPKMSGIQLRRGHVRFGSKAEICGAKRRVRFSPNSDHESGLPQTVMSALPPKADMCSAARDVRFGPIADIGHVSRSPRRRAMHFFETLSPSRSLPVVVAMLRMSLVIGPPRISLVIGQCTSLVVGPRV